VFDIGPEKLLLLLMLALVVLGPDKLPGLARDAARMVRTLRRLSAEVRAEVAEELGPELARLDIRSLDPRTALRRAVLDERR
jgi:sec-independent protein translocase protein TatB